MLMFKRIKTIRSKGGLSTPPAFHPPICIHSSWQNVTEHCAKRGEPVPAAMPPMPKAETLERES